MLSYNQNYLEQSHLKLIIVRLLFLLFPGIPALLISCSDKPTDPGKPPIDSGPSIELLAPVDSTNIGDTVIIIATSVDSTRISRIQFFLNDTLLADVVDSIPPYEYAWSASGRGDGDLLEFSVLAIDSAGNAGPKAAVAVFYRWDSRANIFFPANNTVIDDAIDIIAFPPTGISIAYMELVTSGSPVAGSRDSTSPFSYSLPLSLTPYQIGESVAVVVRAVDFNNNYADSDLLTLHRQWRLLLNDPNEAALTRDIDALWIRSTNTEVHFRLRLNDNWSDYRTILLAIFMDVDQNSNTGATGFLDSTNPFNINDIGADRRLIVGLSGDKLGLYSPTDSSQWAQIHLLSSLNLFVANDTNVLEIYIGRNVLGSPTAIDIVAVNVTSPGSFASWDWAPDVGHQSYTITADYQGTSSPTKERPTIIEEAVILHYSPFD